MGHAHALYFSGAATHLNSSKLEQNDFDSSTLAHLRALRIKKGELISFLSGSGHKSFCKCTNHNPFEFEILKTHSYKQLSPNLILGLALPKKDALAQALTQSTEIGLGGFQLLRSQNSDPSIKSMDKIFPRCQRIIEAAAEQCQAPFLPKLSPEIASLEAFLKEISSQQNSLVVWANENLSSLGQYGIPNIQATSQSLRETSKIFLLVGPEGGWTKDECKIIEAHQAIYPLALGPQILKVPTACVSAITYLRQFVGAPWTET